MTQWMDLQPPVGNPPEQSITWFTWSDAASDPLVDLVEAFKKINVTFTAIFKAQKEALQLFCYDLSAPKQHTKPRNRKELLESKRNRNHGPRPGLTFDPKGRRRY